MRLYNAFLLFLLLSTSTLFAQKIDSVYIFFNTAQASSKKPVENISNQMTFNEWNKQQKKLLNLLFVNGYIDSGIDSIVTDSNKMMVYFYLGRRYFWKNLKISSDDDAPLQYELSTKFKNSQVNLYKLEKEIIHILEEYENHGYPFVQIKLDSIFIENDSLSGIMKIKKGKYFTIDSIHITGSAKIPEKYLYTVIEFKPGDQYQEYKLKTLDEKLKSIAFIEVTQPSEVIFGQDYCYIKIYADNRKINRISGILGLFPDNRSGKTLITGDVSLQLNNALHKAEKIAFQWKRIQVQTQQLSIQFDYPFVFNSIFGIDEDFRLFKRDTSFLDLQNKTGIQLIPDARQKLRLWIKQRNISNLGNSSINYSLANVNQNSVGLGYIFNSTTGKIIPSKGIVANADFFVGRKTINDSFWKNYIESKSYQFEFSGTFTTYQSITKRQIVKIAISGYTLQYPVIFFSESQRIGGINSLRGFNEESIYATSYATGLLEYMFLTDRSSYFSIFYNLAYNEQDIVDGFFYDWPFGFGIGYTFESKAGFFSVYYAVGREQKNPVDWLNGKIHFGLVNYF